MDLVDDRKPLQAGQGRRGAGQVREIGRIFQVEPFARSHVPLQDV